MINYNPLWDTLKSKGVTTYSLRNKYKVSGATIQRLKENKSVSTNTINDLCILLDCDITDIMQFEKIENEYQQFNF